MAGRHLLQVHAKNLARCLQLTADAAGVAFSDNYFDLLAGETRTVEWSGSPGVTFKATSIRDTY